MTGLPPAGAGPAAEARDGGLGRSQLLLDLRPEDAGWSYAGLRVLELAPDTPVRLSTGDSELFVLPLSGGATVEVHRPDGAVERRLTLTGRPSVFTHVSDFAYVGRDSQVSFSSPTPAVLALPSARCEQRRPPAYGPATGVPVEVRGAGTATRQVNNFGVPGVWEHAERLICCELLTPPGNWSSYPPHKHDVSEPCPVVNEEIYYYRIAGADQVTPSRQGFGLHRSYTGPEHEAAGLAPIDDLIEVRDGDLALIRHGYHGPCVAAPGYPMYYLNVLAGPGPQRSMAFCDDPAHGWVRDSWAGQPSDPRCPMTSAAGPAHARVEPPSDTMRENCR